MIKIHESICSDLERSLEREWLETNGIGGYASSTVANANTRRYHGLLVAATRPPLGRMVLLSKLEEAVAVDGRGFDLSTNRYPDAVHPDGYKYLKSFALDPFPVCTYNVEGAVIKRRVFMPHGENTVVCTWELVETPAGAKSVSLRVRPLLAFRDYHHLRREDGDLDGGFDIVDTGVWVRPSDRLPALHFSSNSVRIAGTGHWYRDFEYHVERDRGFDFREDLFQPFELEFDLRNRAVLIASTETRKAEEAEALEQKERLRRGELIAKANPGDPLTETLILAADQFIVERGSGHTVIAGYPWFSDWGRDTMISLPGLTLAAGRPEVAKNVIREFAAHISEGMLPNRFPDEDEEPEYNTVDATLWYFEAVRAFIAHTGDTEFVHDEIYPALVEIVDRHIKGTRYNIRVDADGLLSAGEEGVQLTWMDARIENWVVTPRAGKPVEIQALWYNALKVLAGLAKEFGDKVEQRRCADLADRVKESFNSKFWNAEAGCLYDVVDDEWSDGKIRPNQIFAVSLPHTMLSKARAKKVVETVSELLLTPYGLRSLAPGELEYRERYEGGPIERDSAYHQGTVWAWLLGPFIEAYRKVSPEGDGTEREIRKVLEGVEKHLSEAGLGQVSEVFDAEAPHRPGGCFAQAWSVAELLRVLQQREVVS